MLSRICFLVLLCLSQVSLAEVTIQGTVFYSENMPLSGADISIADTKVVTGSKGEFAVTIASSDIYQFTMTKKGFYESVQTFSHFELANQATPFTLHPVTLVEKKQGRVMFAFSGDAMMGRRYTNPFFGDPALIRDEHAREDSLAIVKHIKPYMQLADLATTNLETQIFHEPPGNAAAKSVAFYSKPEMLDALTWAGIDYVTLGNNHTYDFKEEGLRETLKHLDSSGLTYSGAGFNETEALQAQYESINGVSFGLLGYNGWEGRTTPSQVAEENKGGPAFGSRENIERSVSFQKQRGSIPIVQYHGGYEYVDQPSGLTEQRLKASIDAGAAIAIGHHPHVAQGIEIYKERLIAYSMGNFIFDQYIPSTPFSFILYVWLDEGDFYRAEIVPIYIKGYKPTPATGVNRYTVMKRIIELSKQRNTIITRSGGHGAISNTTSAIAVGGQTSLRFDNNTTISPLYLEPFEQTLTHIELPDGIKYRLGTSLTNGGDFESFDYFDSPERFWFFDRENTVLNNYGASGTKSIGIRIDRGQSSTVGMQPFRRIFKGDNPTTVTAKMRTGKAATAHFYWQGRRYDQGFFQAREESKKHLIGSVSVQASDRWQAIELDYNSIRYNYPQKGTRAYRVMVEITLDNNEEGKVDIDDFVLIEWQSAYSDNPIPLHTNLESKQASYIGIDEPTEEAVKLTHK